MTMNTTNNTIRFNAKEIEFLKAEKLRLSQLASELAMDSARMCSLIQAYREAGLEQDAKSAENRLRAYARQNELVEVKLRELTEQIVREELREEPKDYITIDGISYVKRDIADSEKEEAQSSNGLKQFLSGAAMVGTLWWIHHQKKKRAEEEKKA